MQLTISKFIKYKQEKTLFSIIPAALPIVLLDKINEIIAVRGIKIRKTPSSETKSISINVMPNIEKKIKSNMFCTT